MPMKSTEYPRELLERDIENKQQSNKISTGTRPCNESES